MEEKQIAVSVHGLSKRYYIGGTKNVHNTLRDTVTDALKGLARRSRGAKEELTEFWALRDVSFDVYKGETLGIIGGNGAGKSTLLKILSRIVDPTAGHFTANGRVASLLEVGTGFHPELTGRENLYFNGSVLGMSRREIEERMDEIIKFAEIEKFIDTPVKFYSSGMSVRLGFAIAAHLDPEVLIIDEALAVGDVSFQKKCIDKMRNTARSGKTVLFVSHSMNIIEDLCDRVMYLKNGELVEIGQPEKVMSTYLGTTKQQVGTTWELTDAYVDKPENPVLPLDMRLLDEEDKPLGAYVTKGDHVTVDFQINIKDLTADLSVGVSLFNDVGAHIYRTAVTDPADAAVHLKPGINHLRVTLPTHELLDGPYIVSLDCDLYKKGWIHNPYFSEMRTRFVIKDDGKHPVTPWDAEREGMYKPLLHWHELESVEPSPKRRKRS